MHSTSFDHPAIFQPERRYHSSKYVDIVFVFIDHKTERPDLYELEYFVWIRKTI